MPNGRKDKDKEEALIEGLRNGEDWAYQKLFKEYVPRLIRFLRLQSIFSEFSYADVEDVAYKSVKTLLDRVRSGEFTYQREGGLLVWLKRTGNWEGMNLYRKGDTRAARTGLSPEVLPDHSVKTPDQQLIIKQKLATIWEAYEKFTDREKEVFKFRCLEGKSYQEISDSLGISVENARQIACRCVRKVREALKALGEDENQ